jgi:RNA polymerase sigma-70 factor (ECF subfamily)
MRDNHRLSAADEPLLPLVAGGDREAATRCIRRYGPLVWSIALRLSPTTEDAEDAVQEIFLDMWRHAARFDPARGSEKVFVTMVARRKLVDRMRRRRRRLSNEQPLENVDDAAGPPATRAERDVEIDEAREVFAQLPVPQQRVMALSLVHGMSHAEIVSHTGLPLGTVKTLLRRGLLRVQALLSADDAVPSSGGRAP